MAGLRWVPDGWDSAVRIGVLVPHADVGPESEMRAMAPPGVCIHAARVPFGAIRSGGGMDPHIPPAAADLQAARIAAARGVAIGRVREEVWPDPRIADELKDGLATLAFRSDAELEAEWRGLAVAAASARVAGSVPSGSALKPPM